MPKTQAEIDALKVSWREDPTWDIADSPGFEDHRAELANYQRQAEHERDAAAARRHAAAARRHEAEVQKLISRAAAILPGSPREDELGRDMALTDGSSANVLLRMVAEIVLPLQRQLERQAEDIEAMQRRHEDELDALRRRIGGQ